MSLYSVGECPDLSLKALRLYFFSPQSAGKWSARILCLQCGNSTPHLTELPPGISSGYRLACFDISQAS
ncbi:unnamed protein product [Soboliphyme baturini]|uniref:Uncharacterized protein n=1 Tax=Soboliphyme baturini TaxID=241478 RepID=A0A183IX31_9BILA|nr:unnamed protein product [Soboliphyme baturini]